MSVKLLTEHDLERLSLKESCIGLSESSLVKIPDCWKSYVVAQLCVLVVYQPETNKMLFVFA